MKNGAQRNQERSIEGERKAEEKEHSRSGRFKAR